MSLQTILFPVFTLLWMTGTGLGATFTVTNTNDGGSGSLREAVAAANANVDDDDWIYFDIPNCPNGVCRIVLTSGELVVTEDGPYGGTLTIFNSSGPNNLILSGNNTNRIFNVTTGQLLLLNLTLENGYAPAGGAIRNRLFCYIENSVLRYNRAQEGGAIYNEYGTLIIRKSEITNNTVDYEPGYGGGISSVDGPIQLRDTTVANNVAGDQFWGSGGFGGGVAMRSVTGVLWLSTFENSTISSNHSIGWNGPWSYPGAGGAIYISNNSIPVRFINVTVTGNSAANGGAVAGTGAGISLRNSIVAGNTATTFPEISTDGIPVNNRGNNIMGLPALLGPLASNGGPTRTHGLLPGSPAINAGNNCVMTTNGCGDNNPGLPSDQRGRARMGAVDIGAFEFAALRSPFDFDRDERTDIGITRNSSSTEWWIHRSSDSQTEAMTFGLASDVMTPADFTGDASTDIAVFRPSNGFWYLLRSEDSSFLAFPFGTAGDIPTPGDFDGDGRADPTVFRPSNSTWYQMLSSGGSSAMQFGLAGDEPVTADYDGDGRADVAVFRPTDGVWWIQGSRAGLMTLAFGVDTDKAVPGDYTGDGKADVAVWRPSNGRWYVLRSEDLSYFEFPWGTTDDVPAPGDYDGDGKWDAAVFRPTGSIWFINRSTGTALVTVFGSAVDRPIANAFVR